MFARITFNIKYLFDGFMRVLNNFNFMYLFAVLSIIAK